MKKVFSKEVKIAVTVILCAVILIIGIDFLKGVNLMKPVNYYNIRFDRVSGLALSAPVEISGYQVGLVSEMTYNQKTGKIDVEIDIDKSIDLPEGTYAKLESDLLGTSIIALYTPLDAERNHEPGDTIPGVIEEGLMDSVGKDILPQVTDMLPKIDSILTGINGLVNGPELARTVTRLDAITADLESASGELSDFMTNRFPAIGNNVDTAVCNLKGVTAGLNDVNIAGIATSADTVLLNIKDITAKLNDQTNTLGLLLNERGIYDEVLNTLQSADSLLIDLRKHPKRYVHFSLFGKKDK